MTGNLRERLRRIQKQRKDEPVPRRAAAYAPEAAAACPAPFAAAGWKAAGFQCLKRELYVELPSAMPAVLPVSLPVLIPDCAGGLADTPPARDHLLFFDLETTGLSGGAGTVAFLAAFGAFNGGTGAAAGRSLRITQYLLLDYPGEPDFLEALLAEFKKDPLLIVSFNGKTFDSQILKTRCLMNGIAPLAYRHADLLHPARRLWKRILPDCSQGTIETRILGIDRSGDTPGSLAPDIWFNFLQTGETDALLGISDHNRRDIAGLAAMLALMCRIAASPLRALKTAAFDVEQLALRWREYLRRATQRPPALSASGTELMRFAAETGCPRAALVYALDILRLGDSGEGRKSLFKIAGGSFPADIRAAALRALAIDSEWRLGKAAEALALTERGAALAGIGGSLRDDFRRRAERLLKKTGNGEPP